MNNFFKNTAILSTVFLICALTCYVQAQPYLPLAGGTLTGNLAMSSNTQVQTPYISFNNPYTQPANSANVAIFPNNNYGTLDFVGWGYGFRFIPNSSSAYPAAVVTIDNGGNTTIKGNVGIGTTAPSFPLVIKNSSAVIQMYDSDVNPADGSSMGKLAFGSNGTYASFEAVRQGSSYDDVTNLVFKNSYSTSLGGDGSNLERMRIAYNGNVLIGKTTQANTAYKLDVAGGVRANQIVVNTNGADFVFAPAYQLLPLADVKLYIDKNHHLPDIAPASEMQAKGLDVGDNQTKLLQKIEELTLYLIEKDKEVKQLQQKLDLLQKAVQSITK